MGEEWERSGDDRGIIDRRAGRPAGRFAVHSHGRELFPSDTSSDTHAHQIDLLTQIAIFGGKTSTVS